STDSAPARGGSLDRGGAPWAFFGDGCYSQLLSPLTVCVAAAPHCRSQVDPDWQWSKQAPVQCTRQSERDWQVTVALDPTEKSQLPPRWQTRALFAPAARLHMLALSQRAAQRSPQLPE